MYIWDILANTISRTTTTILSIVVNLIATPPPNPQIKGLEPNSCMTAFRDLIPLNTLFWMETFVLRKKMTKHYTD